MPFWFSSQCKRPDIINGYKIPLPSKPTVFTRFRKIFSKTRSFRATVVQKVKIRKQKRKKKRQMRTPGIVLVGIVCFGDESSSKKIMKRGTMIKRARREGDR